MKDLRCKLTDIEKSEIRDLWNQGFQNYSYLGNRYHVHSKTIRKVIDDDYRIACNEFNRQNWRLYKPSNERHAEIMRNYRKRKKDLKNS